MAKADETTIPAPPKRGRRGRDSNSRQAILDAARVGFATDGYAGTTIRKVASDAGVDVALVMQFFGSKEELFAAVMSISTTTMTRIAAAFDGPAATIGERVARAFLEAWEGAPDEADPLMASLRAAVSNEHSSAQLREFLQMRLVKTFAPKLRNPADAEVRVALASTMLVGIVVGRRIIKIPALAAQERDTIVAMVSPALQAILGAPRKRASSAAKVAATAE